MNRGASGTAAPVGAALSSDPEKNYCEVANAPGVRIISAPQNGLWLRKRENCRTERLPPQALIRTTFPRLSTYNLSTIDFYSNSGLIMYMETENNKPTAENDNIASRPSVWERFMTIYTCLLPIVVWVVLVCCFPVFCYPVSCDIIKSIVWLSVALYYLSVHLYSIKSFYFSLCTPFKKQQILGKSNSNLSGFFCRFECSPFHNMWI